MSAEPEVVAVHVQRLGVAGWAVEAAYAAAATGVFLLLGRSLALAVLMGVGAEVVRFAAFIGVRRRRVVVCADRIQMGGTMIPMADVTGVEAVSRAALRRRYHEPGPVFATRTHIALPEGIALDVVTPEAIAVRWSIGARDARAMAASIRSCLPAAARPPLPATPEPLPLVARQGLRPVWALPAFAIAAAGDTVSIWNRLFPVGVAGIGVLAAWTGLRRVVIDEHGARVGSFRIAWADVEHARVVTAGEAAGIEVSKTRNPPWGTRWALIVVRRGEGEPYLRAAALGIPRPVALPSQLSPS